MVHSFGLKVTIMLHYHDLFDEDMIRLAVKYRDEFGDEIALALHVLKGPGLDELAAGLDSIWLFSEERKRQILELVLPKYREVFGSHPIAIGSYHFDSSTLRILKDMAPEVETVIGGCFEEGVRVFHGCNHSWYLFNEGMPWGPWYPSKTHALRPARDAGDAVDVVALPHLCRDMSLSYEGRNDFWASHPPNVIRGMGNDATWCPYDRNLIDQYRMQGPLLGKPVYYNTFVGPQWLTWSPNSEYPPEVAWELYRKQLQYFAELREAGELQDMTMSDYGAWHRAHRTYDENEFYWAKELLYGSKKHYFWFLDTYQRMLIDPTQGGSIGDFRPYVGQVEVSTGPDTPHREIGSYPYLIQSQHRTGYPNHYQDGSRTTLLITADDETIDLATCRTRVESVDRNGGEVVLRLSPAELHFANGTDLQIVTVYRFKGKGQTLIERSLVQNSRPDIDVIFQEYFKGCYGRTEYAEDLHDVSLFVCGTLNNRRPYDYLGRRIETEAATSVGATVPHLNTEILLSPAEGCAVSGAAQEGHLFNPYYTLSLSYKIKNGEVVRTCITLKTIN